MRLIEYERIRKIFDAKFKETWKMILEGETHLDNLAEGFKEANDVIRELPDIDAVPVVRCKDCAFSQLDGWACGGTTLMPQHRTFSDSFCNYGVRKDETHES